MADLRLPRGPDELLEAVRRPLGRAFGGEQHLRLGGGTALAARWAHRHSVDVDLFTDSDAYLHFQRNTGGRFVLDLTASASVRRLEIGRDDTYISLHGLDGHITISPGSLTSEPRSPDRVRGTSLPFETTAEILGKKLVFRMAQRQTIVSQDLYDIAFSRNRDADSLRTALDEVRPEEFRRIIVAFDDHAAAGHPLTPLIDPADRRLERDASGIIRQLIEREFRQRSPPGPEHGPTFHPSR